MASKIKLVRIPDEHHVVRHCKRRQAIRSGGVVVGVYPEFFHLRRTVGLTGQPEKYLSAFYLEYFKSDAMRGCVGALPFTPKRGEAMVKLRVGRIHEAGREAQVPLRVSHEVSHPTIPCKARIDGMPVEPLDKLCAGLAVAAVAEIEPVE